MKFAAKFLSSGFAPEGVIGSGAIYVDETGIVVEGDIPRFRIPLGSLIHSIICTRGTRTIPFSRILKYSKPAWRRKSHCIEYRLPDKSKRKITFVLKPRRQNDEAFSARFHEYETAMKQFANT